jgi:glycosyl transferase family 87
MPSDEKRSVQAAAIRPRWRLVRFFAAGMLCLHLLFFTLLRERIERGYPDFTVFYTAATMLRSGLGHQLYDERAQYEVQERIIGRLPSRHGPLPYIHPPFEALIFLPLTFLPYSQAFAVWDLLSVVAIFGVAFLLRRSVNALRLIPPWEFVALSLAFFPVFVCLLQGQDSILLLLVCTLGFNALKRQADLFAGCWFALGLFKFQLVVPLLLLIVIWRRRRAALGFAAMSILLVLVSVGLVGWEGTLSYRAFAMRMGTAENLGAVPAALMPNLRGLLEGWLFAPGPGVLQIVLITSSVVLLAFAAWRTRPRRAEQFNLQFSLVTLVALLVGWHTNAHDLSLLVLPLALISDYCLHTLTREPARKWSLLLPVLPILISPFWIALWLKYGKVNLMAIPLLSWAWAIGREISGAGSAHET